MFDMFGRERPRRQFDESPHSSDGEFDEDDWATLDGSNSRGEPSQLRPVRPADPAQPWLDLPPALLRMVFALLPADTRLRCREVCPGWRDMLHCYKALWCKLDISYTSGVAAVPDEAFIRALSHASGHRLEELHARGCGVLTQQTLIRLLRANAGTLKTVTLGVEKTAAVQMPGIQAAMQRMMQRSSLGSAMYDMMSASLPRDLPALRTAVACAGAALEVLEADIRADSRRAVRLLRNRYPRLRVNHLNVQGFDRANGVMHLAGAIAEHPSLRKLELSYGPLAPFENDVANEEEDVRVIAFGKLCDALAAAPHVTSLQLTECSCCNASLEHTGRLLGARTLRQLRLCASFIDDDGFADEHAPFARPTPGFAAGLRASALTHLTLKYMRLFDTTHGADVLRALVGHPTLRKLDVSSNPARCKEAAAAAVTALAALLAADCLTELNCSHTKLGRKTSMGPMYAALATTKRLRKLCARCCSLKARDVKEHVAPAARCSGLLELEVCCPHCEECEAASEAGAEIQAEIAARARAQGYFPFGA